MIIDHGCMRFIQESEGWKFEITDRSGNVFAKSPDGKYYSNKQQAVNELFMMYSYISVDLASLGKSFLEK